LIPAKGGEWKENREKSEAEKGRIARKSFEAQLPEKAFTPLLS